jgi:hypothetical protein
MVALNNMLPMLLSATFLSCNSLPANSIFLCILREEVSSKSCFVDISRPSLGVLELLALP